MFLKTLLELKFVVYNYNYAFFMHACFSAKNVCKRCMFGIDLKWKQQSLEEVVKPV